MEYVTKDQWADWKEHPVTKRFMDELLQLREYGFEELGSGVHAGDVARTYLVIGSINAIGKIMSVDFIEQKD